MSAILSLRQLTEPAYVLAGALISPDDSSGNARVLVASDSVVEFPPDTSPLLTYLSVLRSESEVLLQLAQWGGAPADLADLVAQGLLIRLPADDEEAVRATLKGFAVRMTADAVAAPDGQSVLLRLATNRTVDIALLSAAVLDSQVVRSLDEGVRDVAERTGLSRDAVWRSVLHDLTAILATGAGSLVRVRAER